MMLKNEFLAAIINKFFCFISPSVGAKYEFTVSLLLIYRN